ncbi:unnamed protein product [Ambrosiozyma monospora]|uniref:Unnamed protein product n=1 Tax=Ambrosiozyma monospora TaxID=43982 RepID=A0ACB5U6K0_AMBMO|nr:unnamed protein product [Ambrosiozyma monospora]
MLRRKRFLKAGEDYIIVLRYGGMIRALALDERPLRIQRNLLFFYGYTADDNLDYIERTDLSFLFKFIIQNTDVKTIPPEKRAMIDVEHVDLKNWNLQEIPNFLYPDPILTLDVSQNPSFEFDEDFTRQCRNLTKVRFRSCGSRKFPTNIVYTPRLQELDLRVNYIKNIPNEVGCKHYRI